MSQLVLDVSNVNPINLSLFRESGAAALIAKATEGTGFEDRLLADHRTVARMAGKPFGSYLFLHPDSAGSEAEFYLNYARPKVGEIQPIIDAEVTTQGTAALARRALSCAQALERQGYDPIVYASASIWQAMYAAEPKLQRYRVWEADYPGRFTRWFPSLAARRIRLKHGATVVLWQWTDAFAVGGRRFDASRLFVDVRTLLIPKTLGNGKAKLA